MRTFIRLALVVGILCGAVASPARLHSAQATSQQDAQHITVYVTRTGTKYHRDGCRYLSRSRIPMSLKDAAARFEPCKVCRPPVINRP
jgi:hypothetical protein